MVGNEKKKLNLTEPERKSIERGHGGQQINPQRSVTAPSDDCVQSSADSPNEPIDRVPYLQQTHQSQSAVPNEGVLSPATSSGELSGVSNGAPAAKAFATTNPEFDKKLLQQILAAAKRGTDQFDGDAVLMTLAVFSGTKAKDELDAMQLAQMVAVHTAAMRALGEVGRAEDAFDVDSATRRLIQLTRTYSAQLDARKRYLSGEPRVTVQNVSVTEGGQAIVGNITQGTPTTPPRKKTASASSNTGQPEIEVIAHSEPAPKPQSAKRTL
jgi:hypothetical protein